jgi:hypothetical protein
VRRATNEIFAEDTSMKIAMSEFFSIVFWGLGGGFYRAAHQCRSCLWELDLLDDDTAASLDRGVVEPAYPVP